MNVDAIDLTGFKPAKLSDQPHPSLVWAPIEDLVINREYQRSITIAGRRAIQRMAKKFNWKKYQPILVAPHEGGKFAIVDGQHRAHAAALAGIEKLPAMTVAMTLAEQAAGFAAINRDQIRIDNCALYRAELAAGTPWAVDCRKVVEAAGCKLATSNSSSSSKKPGVVYAITLVRKMVANGEGSAVTAGLAAIRESLCCDESQSYSGPVLSVWLTALAQNQHFMKLNLPDAFDDIDIADVIDRSKQTVRKSGGVARTHAISQVVNYLQDLRSA